MTPRRRRVRRARDPRRGAPGRGRRAGDDPGRAALSRRGAERRVRSLARRARPTRRRARPARLHPSRRRCAAGPTRRLAALALHPRRRRVLGALARRGAGAHGHRHRVVREEPLAAPWLRRARVAARPGRARRAARTVVRLHRDVAPAGSPAVAGRRDQPEHRLQHGEQMAAQHLARLEPAGRSRRAAQPGAAHRAAPARCRFRRRSPLVAGDSAARVEAAATVDHRRLHAPGAFGRGRHRLDDDDFRAD